MKSPLLLSAALCAALGVSYVRAAGSSVPTPVNPVVATHLSPTSPPAAPDLFSPADGATGVPLPPVLQWKRVEGAVKYEWQATRMNIFGVPLWRGEETATGEDLQSHAFLVDEVSPGIEVDWRVRAVDADGEPGPWSAVWTFETSSGNAGSQLAMPTLLAPGAGATNVPLPPRLVWGRVEGAAAYEVEANPFDGFSNPEWEGEVASTGDDEEAFVFAPDDVAPGAEVFWRVRGVAPDHTPGPWSEVFSFRTATLGAPQPQAPANGATRVGLPPSLAWTKVDGAARYAYQANTTSDLASPAWTGEVAATDEALQWFSFAAGQIPYYTDVYWRVRAVTAGVPGPWSPAFHFQTITAPLAAPVLVAPADGAVDVAMPLRLVWRKVPGAVQYRYRITTPTSAFAGTIEATEADEQSVTLSTAQVPYDTEVSWSVYALAADGVEGPNSERRTLTTAPLTLPFFVRPTEGEVFRPGRPEQIVWTGGNAERVDILFQDEDSEGATLIVGNYPAASGFYTWTPDESITCRKCRIAFRRPGDDSFDPVRVLGYFKVEGIELKRRAADGSYEYFSPDRHGWRFANIEENLFPESWWRRDQFDYGSDGSAGIDPFSRRRYAPDFAGTKEAPTSSAFFPDWPSFVEAFGVGQAFDILNPNGQSIYDASFFINWEATHISEGRWNGSCLGMTSLALLIFHDPDVMDAHLGIQQTLYDFAPDLSSNPGARVLINVRQQYIYGRRFRDHMARDRSIPPNDAFLLIQAMLASDTPDDDTMLALYTSSGGHAVVPYRITDDARNARWKRVYVYDPNLPGRTDLFVLFELDTRSWTYNGFTPAWKDTGKGAVPVDALANYAERAVTPWPPNASKATVADSTYHVRAAAGAHVRIAAAGGALGFADGESYSTLDDAYPVIPLVGGPTHPSAYVLPRGAYTLTLSDFTDTTAFAAVDADGALFLYGRAEAEAGQRDHFTLNEAGLSMRNEDPAAKRVSLETHLTGTGWTFVLSDLVLHPSDSVRTAVPEDGVLRLTNMGGPKTYTLSLRQADATGTGAFSKARIVLGPGEGHTIRPDWQRLGTVPVDVDDDGDGQADATIELTANRAPGAAVLVEPVGDVLVGGSSAAALVARWQPADDPDGDALTYRWEFSPDPSFADVRVRRETAAETQARVDFGTLDALLDALGIEAGTSASFFHRVRASDGLEETVSATAEVRLTRGTLTSAEQETLPQVVALDQNYPNPFNPTTIIRYALPAPGAVRLEVFDPLGRRVRTLVDGVRPAGWHQAVFDASDLSSGVYLYRLTAGETVRIRPLMVLR